MRSLLDRLYAAALILSALALVMIAVLVFLQVGGRVLDRVLVGAGGSALGFAIPSLAEIGGFLFVGASFLALPATLRSAGHVRVTLLSRALPDSLARGLTVIVLIGALALAVFATWHSALQVADSLQFDSVSFGMIPIPLAWPQGVMTLGLGIFALAILDELVCALTGQDPAFLTAEAARGIEEGGH